jgi:hypothetical protein
VIDLSGSIHQVVHDRVGVGTPQLGL